MNLLHLSPEFNAPATSAQFARNGEWESAWHFAIDALPGDAAVRDHLSGSTEIAFEVFFGDHFFGARRVGTPEAVRSMARVFVDVLRSFPNATLSALARSELRIPVSGASIAFAEIGCVNAWRSVGPLRLGAPRDALRDFDATWHAVSGSAAARDVRHPKAIEFAFAHETPYWFGVPISEPTAPWRVSRERLRAALQTAAHGP